MVFDFTTPAPAANASTSQSAPAVPFTFGGTSTPATATSTGNAGTPASGTTAPAAAPTTGFTFGDGGGGASNPPAAAVTTGFGDANTPAPATTGFGTTPAPTTGFGGTASGFSFGGGTANANNPSNTTAAPTTAPARGSLTVPPFDELYPGRTMLETVSAILRRTSDTSYRDQSDFAGQELLMVLGRNTEMFQTLLNIPLFTPVPPDSSKRQRLQQNPVVNLPVRDMDGSMQLREASLSISWLQDVLSISDDLQISEEAALCLFHQAKLQSSAIPRSRLVQTVAQGRTIPRTDARTARELYLRQRPAILQTCLLLLQERLQEHPAVLEATDALLQAGWIGKLVQTIQSYSNQVNELVRLRDLPDTEATFWRYAVTLQALMEERQMACECLFYICYHVQLQIEEVAQLIDLVQNLSNQLPVLDPYIDVPDPNEDVASDPIGMFAPKQEVKNSVAWQQELAVSAWKTGLPQLLRCCSTAIMAVVCALGDRAQLMDRNTHAPLSFDDGPGNALLPPGSLSIDQLSTLYNRLKKDGPNWNRKDVQGLLMAAFALLLRSSPSALTTPRAGSASALTTTLDVRKIWRECMEAPTEFRSFTFGRLCLLPALQKPKATVVESVSRLEFTEQCDTSEFLLSALAEFTAEYLESLSVSGDSPISSAKWKKDATDNLKLQRLDQERQRDFRGKFQAYATGEIDNVPTGVNMLDRPDCMDDVIAFASSTCALGSDYSSYFWKKQQVMMGDMDDQETFEYVPSRALESLAALQSEDNSLHSCYLAFLAALSLATSANASNSGASVVHELLSDGGTSQLARKHCKWSDIIETLRYYVTQLDPGKTSARSNMSGSSTAGGSSGSDSKAYYYFASDGGSGGDDRSLSGKPSSGPKALELGEENTVLMLSSLELISVVAAKCPTGRLSISSIYLEGQSSTAGSGGRIDQSSTLMILFDLAVMPLAPDVRGAVFRSIASLLSTDGLDKFQLRDAAQKAWGMLEQCQVLPTAILQQHPEKQELGFTGKIGMAFPPSSVSLGSKKKGRYANQRFGILYEMEAVESSFGVYKSTEGFLQLLTSLFKAGGCPADLGQNSRYIWGCAPYVEFVMNFVLPKTSGISQEQLPFRCADDRFRLLSFSLEVLEAVLVRYLLPSDLSREFPTEGIADLLHGLTAENARRALLAPRLADRVSVATHDADAQLAISDFKNPEKPKSPGFAVLAQMLSAEACNLLKTSIAILVDSTGGTYDEVTHDTFSMAFSLYVSTQPTLSSAQEGIRGRFSRMSQQGLLKGLRPPAGLTFENQATWETISVQLSFRLLSAALAREEVFQRLSSSSSRRLWYAPVLRFDDKAVVPVNSEFRYSPLSMSLLDSEGSADIIACFSNLAGFTSPSGLVDMEIATAALACNISVLRYHANTHGNEVLPHSRFLATALNKQFSLSTVRSIQPWDHEFFELLFNQIVLDLEQGEKKLSPFVVALVGSSVSAASIADSLDQLLELLASSSLWDGGPSIALVPLCYEILYRSTAIATGQSQDFLRCALTTASRLRARDFWRIHLRKMFQRIVSYPEDSDFSGRSHVLHCIAWLLKGFTSEIDILTGFYANHVDPSMQHVADCRPALFGSMCTSLFSEGFLSRAADLLPLELAPLHSQHVSPPSEIIERARKPLRSCGLTANYEVIDIEKMKASLKDRSPSSNQDFTSWANAWNDSITRSLCASHLSGAIRSTIGTVLLVLPEGIRIDGSLQLLEKILWRMKSQQDPSDQSFFASAESNLARSVVLIASFLKRDGSVSQHISEVCNLLVSMIVTSKNREKLLLLGGALSLLLDDTGSPSELSSFTMAASALAREAVSTLVNTSSHDSQATVCLAGSCLSKILSFLRRFGGEETSPEVHALVNAITPRFVKNLAASEQAIARILFEVALFPRGPELLLKSGVCEAFSEAIEMSSDNNCVLELFKLLSSTLTISMTTDQYRMLCGILRSNMKFLEKCIETFGRPTGADMKSLQTVMHPFVFALLHQSAITQKWEYRIAQRTPMVDDELVSPELLSKLFAISMVISESPLPSELLQSNSLMSSMNEKTWWGYAASGGTAPTKLGDSMLTRDLCEILDQGFDVSRLGLIAFRTSSPPSSVDERLVSSLSCTVVNGLEAAEIISGMMTSTHPKDQCDTEDLRALLLKLNAIVTEALHLIVVGVQELKRRDSKAPSSSSLRMVTHVLQRCRFKDLTGLVASRLSASDENGLDTVSDLLKLLEQETSF